MFRISASVFFSLVAVVMIAAFVSAADTEKAGTSVYQFTVKDIDGKDVDLSRYKGQVAMVVNTASRCGLTPQYDGLQKLYSQYKDQGFTVLAFPANNFKGQEPGTDAEIKEFCTTKYNVSFPVFSKISVKGEDQHPLYQLLTENDKNPIAWNFGKFLVDREGHVIARFEPKEDPTGEKVRTAIEQALTKK